MGHFLPGTICMPAAGVAVRSPIRRKRVVHFLVLAQASLMLPLVRAAVVTAIVSRSA
ncbi:hypothetical protein J2Z19_006123 [Ensifer adhaerens]|uniref:Uncharacterized protein n=1 Tax=Ensifer adhaerens TaxID=106592 RepID=A0ACC5T5H1_ENSAD|nr:hypothetical protein [Ensifer adhaerens]